jgi:hypothetical protein
MVQFHWIGSWSNTDYNNSDSRCSDFVGDGSWILCVSIWCLRSIGKKNQNFLKTSSCTVGFAEKFSLRQSKCSIDPRDGSHQWNGINGSIKRELIVEIIQPDAELSVKGKCNDTGTRSRFSDSKFCSYLFEEVLLPMVVISQTSG